MHTHLSKVIISVVFLISVFFSAPGALEAKGLDDYATLVDDEQGEAETQGPPPGMDNLVTMDLRAMDVNEALKYISINGGINIVATRGVGGSVTFMLKDVKVKDVFDIILRTNNLAYEKQGNIYTVMTETEYQARYGKQFTDARKVRIFRLNYAIPENAFVLIDSIKSDVGNVLVDQETGTLLVMDTPEKLKEIEQAIAVLERKNTIVVFDLKYARALDVSEQLKSRLEAKNIGWVSADERSNQIIIQTLPERMQDITRLIESLDQKPQEVLIDAQIVRVVLSDDSNVGIEWEGLSQILHRSGGVDFIGNHPVWPLHRLNQSQIDNAAARVASTTGLDPSSTVFMSDDFPQPGGKSTLTENIYFGKTYKWEAVMHFLNTIGETKILSNPKLVVLNNQEARLHVGKREVYVTTTTTTGQTTTTTSEEVNFIDVGTQLVITPTINEDGYVTMHIRPEISSVVGSVESPSENLIPIIGTSTAESTLMVKDKTTVIMGGLRSDDKVSTIKEPPFLGKLPIIGGMMKRETTENEHGELLILITPHILSGDTLVTGEFAELEKEEIK